VCIFDEDQIKINFAVFCNNLHSMADFSKSLHTLAITSKSTEALFDLPKALFLCYIVYIYGRVFDLVDG